MSRGWVLAAGLVLGAAFAPAQAATPAAEIAWLNALYASTGGPSWLHSTNWNSAATPDPCVDGWYGITCDASDHVIDISLRSNNLSGTLPAGLNTAFSSLAYFNMSGNPNLTGSTMPALAGLSNLTYFNMSGDRLNGTIPPLAGLSNLTHFEANGNYFTGTIPALTGLSNLVYFDLSVNQLTGSIPDLSTLSNLTDFFVIENHLTGPIPALAGLSNLQMFNVSHNQLTGTIPALPAGLMYFWVADNQLSGVIPAAPGSLIAFWPTGGSGICDPTVFEKNAITYTGVAAIDNAWNAATGTGTSYYGIDSCYPPVIQPPTTLPNATVGTAYTDTLSATPSLTPISWAMTGGALPASLTFNSNGTITGKPVAGEEGTYYITVTATDWRTSAAVTLKLTVVPRSAGGTVAVPTLGQWALLLLGLLLGGAVWVRRPRG